MTEKIRLNTAGVPLNGRLRSVDADHATQIIDLVQRGYRISAQCPTTPGWHMSMAWENFRAFVNQPEGTTSVLFVSTTKNYEDARLHDDDWPDWVVKLIHFLKTFAPPTMYVRTGVTDSGAITNVTDTQDAEAG